MNATQLRFYVPENDRYEGLLLWEWLLRAAARLGAFGGSAVRPIGGFGRHHVLHEQKFFELAGSLAVQVDILISAALSRQLLQQASQTGLRIAYTSYPVETGVLNPDAEDSTAAPTQ